MSNFAFGGQHESPAGRCILVRSYHGRRPRGDDAGAADCRGEAAARRDPEAPGQYRTRALLASSGTLGPAPREDRSAADGPYLAGVSPRLFAVPRVSRRAVA